MDTKRTKDIRQKEKQERKAAFILLNLMINMALAKMNDITLETVQKIFEKIEK